LRKYPPVTNIFRTVTNDYKVPESDVVLPKGLTVVVPVYAIHHDPELYENPEVYDPERFTPENEKKRQPCSFLPFGDGPRNCIGNRFGLMQARIGLAVILSNFKFELSQKTKIPLSFSSRAPILVPVGGI
jgi:cytochrome P450 family 6